MIGILHSFKFFWSSLLCPRVVYVGPSWLPIPCTLQSKPGARIYRLENLFLSPAAAQLRRSASQEYSRKDSQRSRNLKEMSKAIFQLAHTLKIDLPPVRYKAGKLNVSQLSIHKRGFSNRSSSRQSWRTGGCEV